MAHLTDDPPPPGVYTESEEAVVRYARTLTRMGPIDDDLYAELSRHFDTRQIVELCFVVGMSNVVNRFHATFLTDVDESTTGALAVACPLPLPSMRR